MPQLHDKFWAEFILLGLIILATTFAAGAAYEHAHRLEPLPHTTHSAKIHALPRP